MKQVVYVASPNSQQIHVWQLDPSGGLQWLQTVAVPGQAQPMAISPDRRHLYVGVRPVLAIITYRIAVDGRLEQVGTAPLPGGPTHISTDPSGRFLFCASYSANCVSVSPIDSHGVVLAPFQQLEQLGAPHSVNVDQTHQILLVPCLKADRIRRFAFDKKGKLTPAVPEAVATAPGAGPRHMAFHPYHRVAYCVNELNSSVDVYHLGTERAQCRLIQTLDAMPTAFAGIRWAADIHITPNGRHLYISDRTASILSIFTVTEEGQVISLVGHHPTETQPRGFHIDLSGNFLIAAGQGSDHIAVYRIDQASGQLQNMARYPVGKGPMWISLLPLQA